jgi:hypothetical protein
MAIREWSGRRLAGTWIAGAVAECVLIALPVVFLFVSALRSTPLTESRIERIAAMSEAREQLRSSRSAAELSKLEALRAVDAAEARVEMSAPLPSAPVYSEMNLQPLEVVAIPHYGLPLAGALAVAFYFLAIPVGLVGITILWLITRLDRNSPPPSSA